MLRHDSGLIAWLHCYAVPALKHGTLACRVMPSHASWLWRSMRRGITLCVAPRPSQRHGRSCTHTYLSHSKRMAGVPGGSQADTSAHRTVLDRRQHERKQGSYV